MVFMGNTKKSVAYMLKHSHFFEPLPDKYIDSAFLDRLHAYNPGWEVAPIRNEQFSAGYGFVVDYIAEVLKHLRTEDFTHIYREHFEVTSDVSTRDQTGFEKTFSGLMKIMYPSGKCTPAETEELLHFSMEARRRVREHILRIDDTFKRHDFTYRRLADGTTVEVLTPEELQYPAFAGPRSVTGAKDGDSPRRSDEDAATVGAPPVVSSTLAGTQAPKAGHVVVPENAKGWSYRRLFGDYLVGARQITVRDPYVRVSHQVRNMVELLQLVHGMVAEGDEVELQLITQSDRETCERQEQMLNQVAESFAGSRVSFRWELDHSPNFHARSIVTDTGWKISLDRGLDMFQRFDGGQFAIENGLQEARLLRGVEVHFVRS